MHYGTETQIFKPYHEVHQNIYVPEPVLPENTARLLNEYWSKHKQLGGCLMKGAKFKIGDIVSFSYTIDSDKYLIETEILQVLKSVDGIEYVVYDTYNAVRPNNGKGHMLTTVREDVLTLRRRLCETVKIDTNFKISQQSSMCKVITVKGWERK